MFIAGLLGSCAREDQPTINKAVWSSRDPFNIPYKRRLSEFMEGNRVFNPSFEKGRFFNDNLNIYELTGWKEIGEEVQWVNIAKKDHDSTEVYAGKHAVKISRVNVSEVEESGVGILSDYIKVIPGNYTLHFAVKMKNLCSNKERLGSRLMDALNVRIYFYDKNKLRVDRDTHIPGEYSKFDNEFKALPFSGFWTIDSMGWIKARGISHKFPFSDGDIPDNTRYVKLFFGLKGTGTLWLDDIALTFSEQNFTLLERMQRLEHTQFAPGDLLVPGVKKKSHQSKISYYNPRMQARHPLILIPENADPITRKAAQLLKQKIQEVGSSLLPDDTLAIPVLSSANEYYLGQKSLVFSIGHNGLNHKSHQLLPFSRIKDKPQGYFIKQLNDSSRIIAISGNEPTGTFYGVTTLIQLLDKESFTYHHADIIDYPDFEERSAHVCMDSSGSLSGLDFLVNHRFNRIFLKTTHHEWQKLKDPIKTLGAHSAQADLYEPGISLNPYKRFQQRNKDYLIGKDTRESLLQFIDHCLENDFHTVLLKMNDAFNMKDSCSCLFSIGHHDNYAKYQNMLDIHSRLINKIYGMMGDDRQVLFLPPWHDNRCIIRSHGKGEMFLAELSKKVPEEVKFVWTGPVNQPFIIDVSEVKYIQHVYHKKPAFLSSDINPHSSKQFLSLYPGKSRMGSIFGNYNLHLPASFSDLTSSLFISQCKPCSRTDKIGIMTLADYLWNSKNFDPDLSLLKVLIAEYGKETALQLIRFNEAYLGLYEMYGKIRSRESKRKYIRSAEDFNHQLNQIMQKLHKKLEGQPIVAELQLLMDKARQYFLSIQDT